MQLHPYPLFQENVLKHVITSSVPVFNSYMFNLLSSNNNVTNVLHIKMFNFESDDGMQKKLFHGICIKIYICIDEIWRHAYPKKMQNNQNGCFIKIIYNK